MHAGFKREIRYDGGVHVDETESRVLGKEMPAARPALFAVAVRHLVVSADIIGAARHAQRFRFPERESVDGAARPASA